VPELITKKIKMQNCKAGRKIVISSNFLILFGFDKGMEIIEVSLGKNKGIKIVPATPNDTKVKKVYSREYKNRRNNPLVTKQEVLMDIRGQKKINDSFSSNCRAVRVIFRYNEIQILPLEDNTSNCVKNFVAKGANFSAFIAMTSGIDGYCLKEEGFNIDTILELRPREARDKTDFTETGALNCLANLEVKHLINEDILNLDIERIAELTKKSNSTVLHASIQCDEFSPLKNINDKQKDIQNNTSSIDMFLDVLELAKQFDFPTILIENVRGFSREISGVMNSRLQRYGYRIHEEILNARDFGGHTNRTRYYMFATKLPAHFEMPKPQPRNTKALWSEMVEPYIVSGEAREVTHSKSLQKGIEVGRASVFERDSSYFGTFTKSQARCAKDSNFFKDEKRGGRLFFPSNDMIKRYMSIPSEIDFSTCGKTIENEIIGQSLEYGMHMKIIKEIKKHLELSYMQLTGKLF